MNNSLTLEQYFPVGRKLIVLLATVLVSTVALGFVAAKQPLWALIVVLAIPIVMAIVVWPDVSILLVMFIMYSNASTIAVQFHHVPFIVGAAVPVLLFIPLAYYLIIKRQKLIFTPVLWLVLLFHGIQVLSTVFSRDISMATDNLVRYLFEGLLLYVLTYNVVRTLETIRKVLWVLLLAGAFLGALGFYQILTDTYHNNYGGFAQVSNAIFDTGEATVYGEVGQPRLAGAIGEQNRHAQTMLMLVPLGLFLLWSERSILLRFAVAILTIFTMIAVAVTFSRGAALGFGVMVMVMVFMRYIKPYQLILVGLAVALLVALLPQYSVRVVKLGGLVGLFVAQEDVTAETKADGSLKGRANEMTTAALVFSDYPVLGVGPHMFPTFYPEYSKEAGFRRAVDATREAHNLYLSIAADNGLLGLGCFLAIIYVTIRDLSRARKRWIKSRPEIAYISTGFILAIVIYLTTGIAAHFSYIRFFWIIMALASATAYVSNAETEASEPRPEDSASFVSGDSFLYPRRP